MNNKLLSFFNYNGFLYEIFIDENSKILYKKIGKKHANDIAENDNKIIKKLLDKIAVMKYTLFDKIEYDNKKLNVYLNLFNETFYISQYYNNREIACEYNDFKSLYDSYNNKIIYNYSTFGGSNNHFDDNHSNNNARTKKKSHSLSKVVTIIVGGVVITATVLTSAVMIYKFKGGDDNSNETSYTEIPYTEITEEQKALEYVREYLKDEEPWVVEQVIEACKELYDIPQEQTEQISTINTTEISENTQKLINSINKNTNISDEDKLHIIENCSILFETSMKYFKGNIDTLCEKLENLKIIYDIKSREEAERIGLKGMYSSEDNEIYIYVNDPETITHEVMHSIYRLGLVGLTEKLSEGYVELYNPIRDNTLSYFAGVYGEEKAMIIILEQIYGKDFMRNAFFNQSIYNDFYDKFDLDMQSDSVFSNEHCNLIFDVNSFLKKHKYYSGPELDSMFERLRIEYETVTGKKWEENEMLKICYDIFYGEHTSDKHDRIGIDDIFIDSEGNYKLRLGKDMCVPLISHEKVSMDVSVSKDFEIGE